MKADFAMFQANEALVEDLFQQYKANPQSVSPEWRAFFQGYLEGFETAIRLAQDVSEVQGLLYKLAGVSGGAKSVSTSSAPQMTSASAQDWAFELKAILLVQAFQKYGHYEATTNPLPVEVKKHQMLQLETYGLNSSDLQKTTIAGRIIGIDSVTLNELVGELRTRYCGTVGLEFQHCIEPGEQEWLNQEWDKLRSAPLDHKLLRSFFTELASADVLEKTLGTKYLGKKRFSNEGADIQVTALETIIDTLAGVGAKEFRIGMAHRGRLNVLIHNVHMPLEQLFAEFEGYPGKSITGGGDVKYHIGWSSDRKSRSGHDVHVAMSFNPSHLEFVDAVTLGEVRARQDKVYGSGKDQVIPLVLHGDAAVSGQGIVYECAQMMKLKGYDVGGTIHIVTNNQVGFTTDPIDSRSSDYASDIAKVTRTPVIHVNSSDVFAVHKVMQLCAAYRNKFHRDIYVDLVCFRRHGHNESDEPTFTQPVMYKWIKEKKSPYEDYLETLVTLKNATREELNAEVDSIKTNMNSIADKVRKEHILIEASPKSDGWKELKFGSEKDMMSSVKTGVSADTLKKLAADIVKAPEGFTFNPKIERIVYNERTKMLSEEKPLDWGFSELLAYASLLNEGITIRLTGQDVSRGTFAHRHAYYVDNETNAKYYPLKQMGKNSLFEIYNSFLSENAALGYEYGYATTHEKSLVIWEAQFGDFSNGAQVMIDQFIAGGETKWQQAQGLVMLLPHGCEGQGPEHSSARPERFLQMCAQGNMQVCFLTQGKQLFHALRRQVVRDFRKPLIVMTPKSFLRNPKTTTSFEELASSKFEEVLDDPRNLDAKKVKRVVFCAGKVAVEAFDLLETQEFSGKAQDVAIVRLEQIYPFAADKVTEILKKYSAAETIIWAQEEPKNLGCYFFVAPRVNSILHKLKSNLEVEFIGRCERASTAVGFEKIHMSEQPQIIEAMLTKSKFEL